MSCLVNPPKPGDPSYEQHAAERSAELASLRRRAHMVTDAFNSLQDVTCNFTEGAMYSFPRLRLPPKAIAAAKAAGKAPDVFYCLRLLEATGISTVPGSGFGQVRRVRGWAGGRLRVHVRHVPAVLVVAPCKRGRGPAADVWTEGIGCERLPPAAAAPLFLSLCCRPLQAEGTFHLRTTILPREEKMAQFVEKFRTFHEGFMAEFS